MTGRELTPEELAVIDKVQKLLSLAGNNPNEYEAAAAMAKAQSLLEAYQIEMHTVEKNTGKADKRSEVFFGGGLYPWQRHLWNEVAKMHHCRYWFIKGLRKGQKYEHKVLGRHSNVVATRVLAEYLQQAIERLAREWAGTPSNFFTKSAVSYRDGMSARVVSRLISLAETREAERRQAAAAARAAGTGPGTALVLADVAQAEDDANEDHIRGEPGYSARMRAQREQHVREWREEQARQLEWDKAHPIEAAERKAKEKAAADEWERQWQKKYGNRRQSSGPKYKGDTRAYWAGYEKGADVGLDQQIDHNPAKRIG